MTTERDDAPVADRRLDLFWGGGERPARGPRPRLSRDQVVRAAVDVADAEGIDAVSMQRVAKELGYTTMSLYRHVPGKEQLLELMADAASGPAPDCTGAPGGWRGELEAVVLAMADVLRRHPWSLHLRLSGPPIGPCGLSWMDALLAPLLRAGLASDEALAVISFLNGAVRELARIHGDIAAAHGDGVERAERAYGDALRRVATADAYPSIARIVADGVFDPPPAADPRPDPDPEADADIVFGLRRLLDGIEGHVRARGAAPAG
ncbi:TetR/AcrR family transcriptional regulator [Nocardiopsis trehalosi]|jgi:AcrR family transcriptional regulator|uniref:TetR/AcrR family transcriptional regulator n=1 Tax=Nocardiopsis trehalosi TaxID=109329 RepID=UPI000834274C|nr:TetR/AcrR family transcriptional regulator [Nocardiopsis trehalosi]